MISTGELFTSDVMLYFLRCTTKGAVGHIAGSAQSNDATGAAVSGSTVRGQRYAGQRLAGHSEITCCLDERLGTEWFEMMPVLFIDHSRCP